MTNNKKSGRPIGLPLIVLVVAAATAVAAAVSATATAAAAAAVATAAAPTAATVAAPATTTTTAATAVAAATAAVAAATAAVAATTTGVAAASGPRGAGLGFIHGQGSALECGPVHLDHRLFGAGVHLDETETAAAAGFTIHNHLRACHGAVSREGFAELVRGTRERQVANVQILRHDLQTVPRENGTPPNSLSDSGQNAAISEIRDGTSDLFSRRQ